MRLSTQDNIDEPLAGDSAARTAETVSDGPMYQFLPNGSRVFRVRVNVRDLSPEELSVSTNDGQLVVTARQALSSGHGQRQRHVTKTFQLPDDVDTDRSVLTPPRTNPTGFSTNLSTCFCVYSIYDDFKIPWIIANYEDFKIYRFYEVRSFPEFSYEFLKLEFK